MQRYQKCQRLIAEPHWRGLYCTGHFNMSSFSIRVDEMRVKFVTFTVADLVCVVLGYGCRGKF